MKWQPSDSLRQWSFVPHQNSRRGPGICRHRAGREQALPVAAKSLDLAAMTNRFERGNPASPPLCPAMSYQPAVILTYEDGFWRFSAQSFRRGGSVRSDDVVHRYEGATMSEGRQKPPAGLSDPPAGQRRDDEPHRRFRCFLPANGSDNPYRSGSPQVGIMPSAMTNRQRPMSVQTVGYIDRKSQRITCRVWRRMRTERPPK